jgi:hypothetical protein
MKTQAKEKHNRTESSQTTVIFLAALSKGLPFID